MKRFQQTAYALGSEVLLTIIIKDEVVAKPIFQALWAQIQAFDKCFSRFQPDSELSKFNLEAGKNVDISPRFKALLETSIQLSKKTKGLYNPFVLPALQRAGYIGSWPTPENYDKKLNYAEREVVTFNSLHVGRTTAHIPANTALDFGGIGKGYLLDMLADLLEAQHVKNYWLSLGGDIICAGYDIERRPWRISIADSKMPEKLLTHIKNPTGHRLAIATSGTTKRKGGGWHHIIDPQTQKPAATDIRAATITYDNATEADVYATCLVVVGSGKTESFMMQHNIKTALLQVSQNGSIQLKRYGGIK